MNVLVGVDKTEMICMILIYLNKLYRVYEN